MRKQRSAAALERQLEFATTEKEKAVANYNLGLFHDNNGREAKAIPYYRTALQHGLNDETKAQALAWLASSLHKTGNQDCAMDSLKEAQRITTDASLNQFLSRLERRVQRTHHAKT
ncbi:MAG: tetratricopeptide repeat protein [Dehalococcoidia bacterium]|nr:tetratricopeptide repeat protein [Dehalococcoidia bacterium]